MRIAVQETLLGDSTPGALFDHAAALGVDGIELFGDRLEDRVPDIAHELVRTGIPIAAIHFGKQGALLAAEEAERERALDRLRSNIACAVDLNAAGVVVVPHYGALTLPDLSPWMTSGQLYAEMLHQHLRTLSDFAHALGTKLFIQPASKQDTAFITRLEQAGAVVKRIKHPDVKIAAELACLENEATDQESMISKYGEHVNYTSLPADRMALTMAAALREAGYDGWISLGGMTPMTDEALRSGIGQVRAHLRLDVV